MKGSLRGFGLARPKTRRLKPALLNPNLGLRNFAVAGAILDRQNIFRGPVRGDMNAAAEGRPDRLFRLRLDLQRFRVGHAIAQRTLLSGFDDGGIRDIRKNFEAIAAHHFEGLLILRALLLRRFFR